MIRANEAKKKAENYMGSRIEKELSMINVLILKQAIRENFLSVMLEGCMS